MNRSLVIEKTQASESQQVMYHKPVMLTECLNGLYIRPEGTYIDVTFGGGGHSLAILEHIKADG